MAPFPSRTGHDRGSRPLATQRRAAALAAIACLVTSGYLFIHQREQSHVRAANEHGLHQRFDRALAEAREVERSPALGRALLSRAHVAQSQRRHADAIAMFRRAAERDPRAWHVHRDWAVSLLAVGKRAEARRRLEVAASLNPRLVAPVGF